MRDHKIWFINIKSGAQAKKILNYFCLALVIFGALKIILAYLFLDSWLRNTFIIVGLVFILCGMLILRYRNSFFLRIIGFLAALSLFLSAVYKVELSSPISMGIQIIELAVIVGGLYSFEAVRKLKE